jgi:hypothetical protein
MSDDPATRPEATAESASSTGPGRCDSRAASSLNDEPTMSVARPRRRRALTELGLA